MNTPKLEQMNIFMLITHECVIIIGIFLGAYSFWDHYIPSLL